MSAITDAEEYLRLVDQPRGDKDEMLLSALAEAKAAALKQGDERQANHIWCLEEAISLQSAYLKAFTKLREKSFYAAWCNLADAEVTAGHLLRHFMVPGDAFRASFIAEAVDAVQKLFPYHLFFSPEILEGERHCSICNLPVLPRKPCGHEVGELYRGEMCCIVVHTAAILGMSLVEYPMNKVNVPFIVDEGSNEKKDHYDYSFVEAVTAQIPSPFTPWRLRWEASRLSHKSVGSIGRNDKCPCRSRKKYKHCCLPTPGIRITRTFLELLPGSGSIRSIDVGGILGEVPEGREAVSAGFDRNTWPDPRSA